MDGLLPHLVFDPPITIVALLVVGGSLLATVLLLVIFNGLLPVDLRSAHNDVAGFTIAIVGVIYAVLLAFIAVSAWESHGKAEEVVQIEANMVGNLYVDSIGLPPEVRFRIWRSLRDYTNTVIDVEWPSQHQGRVSLAGWSAIINLNSTLAAFKPSDGSTIALKSELIRTADDLFQARRNRLEAATSGIPRGDVGRYFERRSLNNHFQLFLRDAEFPDTSYILRDAGGFPRPSVRSHSGA